MLRIFPGAFHAGCSESLATANYKRKYKNKKIPHLFLIRSFVGENGRNNSDSKNNENCCNCHC